MKCETLATGRKTYRGYTARGELYRTWGDVPYPKERVYSDYGELSELHTFRAGTGWYGSDWPSATCGTADFTRWIYQAHRGLRCGAAGDLSPKAEHREGGTGSLRVGEEG